MLAEVGAGSLDERCRAVFERNRATGVTADGVAYDYHRPDRDKFPAQFHWDSCFHAFALARLDPAAGREELRTLLRAQEPDGFLGHTSFWDAPMRPSRRLFYNVQAPGDRMTRTIQPPFLALAWEAVAAASTDDPGFGTESLRRLAGYLDWLERERDLDGAGLIGIVQPDESGCDASPAYDQLVGRAAGGLPGFVGLVRRNRRDGFRAAAIRAHGGPWAEDVLVNTAYALSLQSMHRLSGEERWARRAERVRDALLERCWDPRDALFYHRSDGGHLRVSTWTSLAPLALPGLPREVADALVERHVLDERRYWLPFPIPSTAADEPSFRRRTRGLLRYWRGPTWMPCPWLVQRGLLAHGYEAQARELARRVERLVGRSGLREYYDPIDGHPMGAKSFGMSTLASVIAAA